MQIFSSLVSHGKPDVVRSIFCVKTEQFVHEYFLKTYTELAKQIIPPFALGAWGQKTRNLGQTFLAISFLNYVYLWISVWLRATQMAGSNSRGGATKQREISCTSLSINIHFSVHKMRTKGRASYMEAPEDKMLFFENGTRGKSRDPGHIIRSSELGRAYETQSSSRPSEKASGATTV